MISLSMRSKKIIVVSGYYPITSSPSYINLVRLIEYAGIKCEFIHIEDSFEIETESSNKKIHNLTFFSFFIKHFIPKLIKNYIYENIFWLKVISKARNIGDQLFKSDVDDNYYLAIDRFGAYALKNINPKKIVYYSLEIDSFCETLLLIKIPLDLSERRLAKFSPLFLIQTKSRLKKLEGFLRQSVKNPFFLPVSVSDTKLMSPVHDCKINFKKNLGICERLKIILFAGSLPSFEYLYKFILFCPSGYIVCIHAVKNSQLLTKISSCNELKGKYVISVQNIAFDKLDEQLFACVDFGVLIHPPSTANHRLISFSSGKLAQFLKNSIPVIVSPGTDLDLLIHDYGCGEILDKPENLNNLKLFSQENFFLKAKLSARHCFEKKLNFDSYKNDILDSVFRVLNSK
jgi:hypothetical protein